MFSPYVTKAYVNHREKYPADELAYSAMKGFALLGIETAPFYGFGDIASLDLTHETIVCGYVGDVREAFKRLNCPELGNIDYPKELEEYLGRHVRADKLGNVRYSTDRFFLKPVQQKAFSGHVRTGTHADALRIVTIPDDTDVWISDIMNFVSEHRVFVMYGLPVGIRWYKGDPFVTPNKAVIKEVVEKFCVDGSYVRNDVPHACTIDFGVTNDGNTRLIEVNEGFAFGGYGLGSVTYARMLDARWRQVVGHPPAEKIYKMQREGGWR
jgi:hypothetical protein